MVTLVVVMVHVGAVVATIVTFMSETDSYFFNKSDNLNSLSYGL